MSKRIVSGIILTLLLISISTFAFNIQPVKAEADINTEPNWLVDLPTANGTIYIRPDGSIDPAWANITTADTVTYVFTDNNYENIIVEKDNIVIDGGGYTLQRKSGSGIGIYAESHNNITVKNVKITTFNIGVAFLYSANSVVSGSEITSANAIGVAMLNSSNISIYGNNITDGDLMAIGLHEISNSSVYGNYISAYSSYGVVFESSSTNNKMYENTIKDSGKGVFLWESSNNEFYHNNLINNTYQVYDHSWDYPDRPISVNVWDDGYPSGGNHWSDYAGVDLNGGPNQDLIGSDGIGDTPYAIYANNMDHYPLLNPWTPVETSVQIGGNDYPVTIVSNTSIDKIVATKNSIHFESSGPTGDKGYINVIFPMVNTTEIKVFIDDVKLTPPPFPVINTNGTHYFIYFEFILSTHTVAIQFAAVTATIDIDPDRLNLKSNGEFITVYIELPEGYDVADINLFTVQLDGIPAITHEQYGFVTDPDSYLTDHDGDGILERMVKFDRATVRDTLTGVVDYDEGTKFYDLSLTVTGELYGTPFEGTDTIVVIGR